MKTYFSTPENVWNNATSIQKKNLLKASGLSTTFSKVKNFNDLPKRSGGHVFDKVSKVVNIYNEKHKGLVRINK